MTPRAEPSAYARCFGIFALHLVGESRFLLEQADELSKQIGKDLTSVRRLRTLAGADLAFDKPYLQLLCFSLSALSILRKLADVTLEEHIDPLARRDISEDLKRGGCLIGNPSSGNQAMFIAVINIYAAKWLNFSSLSRMDVWIDSHLSSMNKFGFWGKGLSMTHSQFQNGYHQYEIFEYLGVENIKLEEAADSVARLVDQKGHFGPYPGGGGCYDYDAIAILTSLNRPEQRYRNLLERTANALLAEQNADGGFCESRYVRPISLRNLSLIGKHVICNESLAIKIERALLCCRLVLPKYGRIHDHWSIYAREWHESDLWDSWFRMLTLARIQLFLDQNSRVKWGSIDFPGIGYIRSNNSTGVV